MKSETTLMRRVMSILSRCGARVFRNNVGGTATLTGGWIDYGLCTGSSDVIGWHSVEVTPNMVGKQIAVFLACEVKMPGGRTSTPQKTFLRNVRDAGGIALVVRSEQEAEDVMKNPLAFWNPKA